MQNLAESLLKLIFLAFPTAGLMVKSKAIASGGSGAGFRVITLLGGRRSCGHGLCTGCVWIWDKPKSHAKCLGGRATPLPRAVARGSLGFRV